MKTIRFVLRVINFHSCRGHTSLSGQGQSGFYHFERQNLSAMDFVFSYRFVSQYHVSLQFGCLFFLFPFLKLYVSFSFQWVIVTAVSLSSKWLALREVVHFSYENIFTPESRILRGCYGELTVKQMPSRLIESLPLWKLQQPATDPLCEITFMLT